MTLATVRRTLGDCVAVEQNWGGHRRGLKQELALLEAALVRARVAQNEHCLFISVLGSNKDVRRAVLVPQSLRMLSILRGVSRGVRQWVAEHLLEMPLVQPIAADMPPQTAHVVGACDEVL